MSERNDGGPAFPQTSDGVFGGMSLREYFAAAAPILTNEELASIVPAHPGEHLRSWQPRAEAEWAYLYADAMLAARDAIR